MTQNTEQKVRTFDTQISMMAEFIRTGPSGKGLEGWLSAHIRSAEARGVAEQRRKDAEGHKPYAWEHEQSRNLQHATPLYATTEGNKVSPGYKALYTHPANVAALEARVKELEGENTRLKTAQFYGNDEAESGSDDISTFFDDHDPGAILEIDGYRRVNTKWVLWDGNSSRAFDTEEEARTALKREGGG